MSTVHDSAVLGVFENRAQAEVAVNQLWHAGFAHEDVGLAAPGERPHVAQTPEGQVEDTAARGAVTGAMAGGAVGAVAGALATAFIPGIGPVLASGIVAGAITGGAAGAAAGTFAGPFIALGISEHDAHHYAHQVGAGNTVVVVRAGERAAKAEQILRENGATDVTGAVRWRGEQGV